MSDVLAQPLAGPERRPGTFHLKALGGLEMFGPEGRPCILPTRKTLLLTAYLATQTGFKHSRPKLAALLWPDRGEDQARGSPRKALSALRAQLGRQAVLESRDGVGLDASSITTDVGVLEELARGDHDLSLDEAEPFCRQFMLSVLCEGEDLSEWVAFERTRCLSLAQKLLTRLALAASGAGRHDMAIGLAQRLVALDPLREQSHRVLMEIYGLVGDRSLALRHFRECRRLLRDELGVAPSVETARLARQLSDAGPASEEPREAPHSPRQRDAAYKYSVAVLPLSPGGENELDAFVAMGLADDVITALSRDKDLIVVARQSSFAFGSQASAASDAASQLGVRYVLSGNVRRFGGRLRVNVRLTDSATGASVWAERFDQAVGHMFDAQEEIAQSVAAAIDTQLRFAERERTVQASPRQLDAWELHHRGLWHTYNFTPEDLQAAAGWFERAIEKAPDFALPHAGLGYLEVLKANWLRTDDPAMAVARGLEHARRAMALDAANTFVLVVAGRLLTLAGERERAFDHLLFARRQNPSYAHVHYALALAFFWAGRPAGRGVGERASGSQAQPAGVAETHVSDDRRVQSSEPRQPGRGRTGGSSRDRPSIEGGVVTPCACRRFSEPSQDGRGQGRGRASAADQSPSLDRKASVRDRWCACRRLDAGGGCAGGRRIAARSPDMGNQGRPHHPCRQGL